MSVQEKDIQFSDHNIIMLSGFYNHSCFELTIMLAYSHESLNTVELKVCNKIIVKSTLGNITVV